MVFNENTYKDGSYESQKGKLEINYKRMKKFKFTKFNYFGKKL